MASREPGSGLHGIQSAARELQRVLQQDLVLGRRLLANVTAQTQALTAGDTSWLGALLQEGREMAQTQEGLDAQRGLAAALLAKAVEVDCAAGSAPPLSELALRMPLAEARVLLALRRAILTNQQHLKAANERNRKLIETGLEYANFCISTMTALALRPARYGVNPHAVARPTFYIDQAV